MSTAAPSDQTIHEAVVAALSELSEIVADEEADTGQYKYRYAPLATIMRTVRPVLARHGLIVSQLVSAANHELSVGTVLLHKSGQQLQSGVISIDLPPSPQRVGSAISYLRRYQLVALLGLAVEDDDGRKAQFVQTPAPPARRTSDLTDAQRRHIMALFGDLGMSGAERRDDRLALVAEIIGRDIDSTNEVTRDEARALIDELGRRVDVVMEGSYDR